MIRQRSHEPAPLSEQEQKQLNRFGFLHRQLCSRCGHALGPWATQTYLARGTGFCNACAAARLGVALTQREARGWLSGWKERMVSALEIVRSAFRRSG